MSPSAKQRRRVRGAILVTLGLGAIAMVLAHQAISAWSRARMLAEFQRRARMVLGPLQAELDASLELTQSLADVQGARLPISSVLFETVAAGARVRHPELRALTWIPRVRPDEVEAFEQGMRRELGDYRIFGWDGAAATAETTRFPIAYISPRASNRAALGLDLGSEPDRRATIAHAIASGRPAVSPILPLVQGGDGILVMVPSYYSDRPQGTPAEREAALHGLGVAVYGDQELEALAQRAAAPLEVSTTLRRQPITDVMDVDAERSTINSAWSVRSIAEHDGRGPVLDLLPDLAPGEPHGWYLRISPASGASWLPNPLWPWLGVLTVGALVALAGTLIQRTAKARRLADELTEANIALADEVHERTEAEQALKRQATLVSLSLDTMNLVAWHFDCRTCELTRVSAAAPVTTQVLPETSWTATLSGGIPEHTRTGLFGGIPDGERPRVVAYVQEVLARRENECRFEFQAHGDDGLPRHIAVIGRFARDAAGRLLSFTGLQLDVTDRRRIEEERRVLEAHLQDTQRLESLGVLAGGVAHDFNNLIMGIVGGVTVLQERCTNDDPMTRRALALIERGTTRAAELTRQLLVYAGREQTVVEPTALGAVVQDMLPLLETSAGKHVTLALTVEHVIPAVQADLTQLRQIIMNLVINAAEATSAAGGTVAVTVGSREYDRATLAAAWPANDLAGGRYVFLEVRDSGCGMSPQTQQRIFDPFFTTKFTGRGLGLAAVLGLVRGHHGAVVVNSTPGQGATFTVLFPPVRAAAHALAAASGPAPVWRGSGTVLVVDDEEIARETTAAMLGMIGFDAVAAADGREALARVGATDTTFAAIILDLTMPGQNGLEVHGELRRRAPTLPVVLMSGYSAQDARAVVGNGRSTAFLQKPFRLADLATALRDVIEPAARA